MKLICGDCLEKLKELPESSVDSIVTDPPYELGFMGKSWDNTGIANNIEMWSECLRVLKPGGHLLAFSGTRTYHRMASAIEDAGFEVRDMMCWAYGQGFPKSLNISLQIKKKYNIGLCTCNVFEPMIQLGYENSNNKRDNISNGDNDGLSFGKQIQSQGNDDNEMEKQVKDTDLSSDGTIRKESGVCELSEKNNQKEQGLKKVGEPILQSELCEPISENKGLGNTTIRTGVEENQTTSEGQGQSLSDMQDETTNRVASSSLDTIQNGGQKHNGEPCGSLSELPQQDRENNRKRVEQIKNDCNAEEWNNLSRFICSKCYCLKKDIGGTALKPSIEPICMARKPLEKKLNVAENCLKWGTGGINIDECRVESSGKDLEKLNSEWDREWNTDYSSYAEKVGGSAGFNMDNAKVENKGISGRFPANVIHDNSEEVRECFPETKKGSASGYNFEKGNQDNPARNVTNIKSGVHFGDEGSASRFFKSIIYQAKASKSERNKGCEDMEDKERIDYGGFHSEQGLINNNRNPENRKPMKNGHPCVKPIALMEYLIKMVTPKGGIVLDPFMGSGSTGVAALKNGFDFIGIEKEEEYIKIAEARIKSL